jgi:hypothetical protein
VDFLVRRPDLIQVSCSGILPITISSGWSRSLLKIPPPDLPPELIALFRLELNPIPNCFVWPVAVEGQTARQPPVPRGRSLMLVWGRIVLRSCCQFTTTIFASFSVKSSSRFNLSSPGLSLKLSLYPFSQGLLGSMNSVFTPTCFDNCRTTLDG